MEPEIKVPRRSSSLGRTVLGLDPGSRRTGFGILRSEPEGLRRITSGTIKLDESRPFAERLPHLHRQVRGIIETHHPDIAVLETCFVSRSARAALVLGHTRGVLLLVCLEAEMEVFEYTPAEVKRAITGSGAASKPQIKTMLPRLLIDPPKKPSDDEADALSIAYCHINRLGVGGKRAMLGLP
jgi:crossover junction endodeoxyribonuclease RuvC